MQNFLNSWQDHLLIGDYAGYKPLFTLAGNCTELGCWAHARRKLFDLTKPTPVPVLQRIGGLYAIEAEGKHLSAEARQILHTEKSLPIDNNPVESTIRPIASDKKNWLFTGSKRA